MFEELIRRYYRWKETPSFHNEEEWQAKRLGTESIGIHLVDSPGSSVSNTTIIGYDIPVKIENTKD